VGRCMAFRRLRRFQVSCTLQDHTCKRVGNGCSCVGGGRCDQPSTQRPANPAAARPAGRCPRCLDLAAMHGPNRFSFLKPAPTTATCLDLAAAVRLDQDVFGLQVGVHQAQGVQEGQRGQHLRNKKWEGRGRRARWLDVRADTCKQVRQACRRLRVRLQGAADNKQPWNEEWHTTHVPPLATATAAAPSQPAATVAAHLARDGLDARQREVRLVPALPVVPATVGRIGQQPAVVRLWQEVVLAPRPARRSARGGCQRQTSARTRSCKMASLCMHPQCAGS